MTVFMTNMKTEVHRRWLGQSGVGAGLFKTSCRWFAKATSQVTLFPWLPGATK